MKNKRRRKEVLEEMKNIYYPNMKIGDSKYLDWMGYPITNENTPSYHHIKKYIKIKSNKEAEQTTIENGAYLGEYSHIALHQIEKVDKNLYNRWNDLFKQIIIIGTYPNKETWSNIFNLQIESEELFNNNQKEEEGMITNEYPRRK